MKRFLVFFIFSGFFACSGVFAQKARDYCVQVSAKVVASPPSITLEFPPDVRATSYQVYRKLKDASSWGAALATLAGTDTSYTDLNVTTGKAYEYRVHKFGGSHQGQGYVYAGIEVPPIESRGKMLLVIDTTHAAALSSELARLELDLIGDGWRVVKIAVDSNESVSSVKAKIVNQYNLDPLNVKSVFLFGNIAVPYSGDFGSPSFPQAPDAHTEHVAAWPSDIYYGEMFDIWTDAIVSNSSGARAANHNVPGDGKFDVTAMLSDAELQVGRVDLANMPQFSAGERELLRRYLEKNHNYRHRKFKADEKGVLGDNFGVLGGGTEIPSTSGWRNLSALFGAQNIDSGNYFAKSKVGSYLFGYGTGAGSYTSAAGVGTTTKFSTDTAKVVFSMLFGSYFGDWDNTNNFLRAPLASGTHGLTNVWSGRPHMALHHMALGENIGYSVLLSQNNQSTYFPGPFAKLIHPALMGDPSLRLHTLLPAGDLTASALDSNKKVGLVWNPSSEAMLGYYVYRSDTISGQFTRITPTPLKDTSFVDNTPLVGSNVYMVRALGLQLSGGGTYQNLSQGVFASVSGIVKEGPTSVRNQAAGNLIAKLFPNPASDKFGLVIEGKNGINIEVIITDIAGRHLLTREIRNENSGQVHDFDLNGQPKGVYLVRVSGEGFQSVQKLILQ